MDAEMAKRIISEQISLLGSDYDSVEIQFMGGEPLLEYPLIKEVSEWLWNTTFNKKLTVLFAPTNGTLLNSEMKIWFASNKEKIHLGLSFDGNALMQNRNRSMSFDAVDLDFFAKTWPAQSVKMTISPDTIGSLYDGVKFLHDKGFKYLSADLAMGRKVVWNKKALIDYQSELKKLCEYYMYHKDLVPVSMLRLNIVSIWGNRTRMKTCSCGEDMVCVDCSGKSYACHLFSPVSVPTAQADKSNKQYDFSNHLQFVPEKCSKCLLISVCNNCYGMNYLCTGDVTKPSPFHCSAFKITFAANCRLRLAHAEKENDNKTIETIHKIINLIR